MDVKFLDDSVTVRFLKTESEQNFGFPHIPSGNTVMPITLEHYKLIRCW